MSFWIFQRSRNALCARIHFARLAFERLENRYTMSGETLGVQTVLCVPVDFSDKPGTPLTSSEIEELISGVNDLWQYSSYGKQSLAKPVVLPLLRMPQTSEFYRSQSTSVFRDDMRDEVSALGYDYSAYFAHMSLSVSGGVYKGYGGIGFTGGWAHINGGFTVPIISHELGHVMRLPHASGWDASTTDPIGPGTWIEGGNRFDTMGGGGTNHSQFNAFQKATKLKWLDSENDVATVSTSGIYRLHAFDLGTIDPERSYALKIPRTGGDYWIEFRQNDPTVEPLQSSVVLYGYPNDYTGNPPIVIDTTPNSIADVKQDFYDAPLQLHHTFSDFANEIHITPIAQGGTGIHAWIDVRVVFGEQPINDPPIITSNGGAVSATLSLVENTLTVTQVSATDVDSIDLNYSISGGADALNFQIDAATGALSFRSNPDFEAPTDANRDNIYIVKVRVTDGQKSAEQTLSIHIQDQFVPVQRLYFNSAASVEIRDAGVFNQRLEISRSGQNLIFIDRSGIVEGGFKVSNLPQALISADHLRVTLPVSVIEGTHKPLILNTVDGNDEVWLDTNVYGGDVIPTVGFEINLGKGTDTLDLVDSKTANVWKLLQPQQGELTIGKFGTVRFSGLEHANGGAGKDTLRIAHSSTNKLVSFDGDVGHDEDTIEITRDAHFTLTNHQITIEPLQATLPTQTLVLKNMHHAKLTGGASSNHMDAEAFDGKTTLTGLAGDDILLGGTGTDFIFGNEGNDWLGGGNGNDVLNGGNGSDILVGGNGFDVLNQPGSALGDDILISGRTLYEGQLFAANEILHAWSGRNSFSSGVTKIRDGFISSSITYYLNGSSVFDDDVEDLLYGGAGLDWFLAELSPSTAIGKEIADVHGVESSVMFDL